MAVTSRWWMSTTSTSLPWAILWFAYQSWVNAVDGDVQSATHAPSLGTSRRGFEVRLTRVECLPYFWDATSMSYSFRALGHPSRTLDMTCVKRARCPQREQSLSHAGGFCLYTGSNTLQSPRASTAHLTLFKTLLYTSRLCAIRTTNTSLLFSII